LFATSFSRRKTTALPRYLWKKYSSIIRRLFQQPEHVVLALGSIDAV
jgi:hypothetical protein